MNGRRRSWWRGSARCGDEARFTLLFHDTHHRGVSDADALARLPLDEYDAVLAFGETLRARYERPGWGRRAFTWHEAADTRLFRPLHAEVAPAGLIWIGNWGDGERSRELGEFLIEPATRLGLAGTVHGVRYPEAALERLAASPLDYRGWIANADVPAAFARHRMTVHVPRRPVCGGAARHSDDPRVRGAGLRHSAGLRAVERRGGAVPARRGFPGGGERRGDDAAARAAPR